MFSSTPNYTKLKTNLRLAIHRLKLLEKKKTELALKARKEIADYISTGKIERAKIRVEHIIREDYLVEAMEVTEMYCDLLLARFGLIQQMKDLDEGLAEAISSLIWVAPRLMTDVGELKLIADNLALKYGKPYAQACREQAVSSISEKLIHKLSVQSPPKVLIEKYLVEIAHNYNLEYEADPQIMREADWETEDPLVNLTDTNDLSGGAGGGFGGGEGGAAALLPNVPPAGFLPNVPPAGFLPNVPPAGFNYPNIPPQSTNNAPFDYPQKTDPFNFPAGLPERPPGRPMAGPPPADMLADTLGAKLLPWDDTPPPPYSPQEAEFSPTAPYPSIPPTRPGTAFPPDMGATYPPTRTPTDSAPKQQPNKGVSPQPAPRSRFDAPPGGTTDFNMPDLPDVPGLPDLSSPPPSSSAGGTNDSNDDIDFDNLNKRFEELKKK